MEHLFKGYAIAKIEYGGWGDSHSVITGALFKIFPTRTDQTSMDMIYLIVMNTQNMEL